MADPVIVIQKVYDLILWVTPLTEKFPRTMRHSLAGRLNSELLSILRLLIEARYTRDRRNALTQANLAIEYVRHLIRLSRDLKAISPNQYEHGSRLLEEIGRMIGGWRKSSGATSSGPRSPSMSSEDLPPAPSPPGAGP